MSDRISVMPHLLDCLACEEVVAVENVSLALQKLQFERSGMSKLVNVGIFRDMFEVSPCEQHERLSDIVSFPRLHCIDMMQYHSITTLYLEDLEIKHMDLMNLTYTIFFHGISIGLSTFILWQGLIKIISCPSDGVYWHLMVHWN